MTGATYYVQAPSAVEPGQPSIINYGPFRTLPEAREALQRLEAKWPRTNVRTPPGQPALMIVKVVESRYLGAGP